MMRFCSRRAIKLNSGCEDKWRAPAKQQDGGAIEVKFLRGNMSDKGTVPRAKTT